MDMYCRDQARISIICVPTPLNTKKNYKRRFKGIQYDIIYVQDLDVGVYDTL